MMNKNWIILPCLAVALTAQTSCSTNGKQAKQEEVKEIQISVPEFDADSAYSYIQAQVNFGPRVPNTKEHQACGNYLAAKLEEFGAQVTNQYADLIAFDGTVLKARNIIGSYRPDTKKRVMLFAHWDTRPWADNDRNSANHRKPVLGANDGASGVGILLEIARRLQQQLPAIGIDILFFDAEDYGTSQFHTGRQDEDTWALGSQYWAKYPHVQNYNARFGILLDMVGGEGATFYQEYFSRKYAPSIVKKVWDKAHSLGHANYFIKQDGPSITDDHLYVNRLAKIPCIDIIPYDEHNPHSNFGSFWHTVHDDMDGISRSTLNAVGQTVMAVIYNEK